MALARSKVTSQGQVSIPLAVRRRLGVGPGSTLEWDDAGGQVVLRRAGRFTSQDVHQALFGAASPKARGLAELKAGIARHMRRRHARG
ncbi:MAG: AbrB/MazE/SpoVT family DNA-binding domain-containing protein [Deltaproteobacteria bacterium]|nr:AbrB/MazE/SpoVT family DNA-binding domain-containing protein [Deltaproteobacteria bacterium]